ncbi:MAG: putative methyltransferase [Ilumatobacteraceae bacterium]|nr:putative methyltransferase [Ilumatobacteraceae bacterium]
MTGRSAFSGGDQEYLRDVQYASGAKLDARSYLHRTFATSAVPLAHFEAALIDWSRALSVLECGCGTGRFWDNDDLPRSLSLTLTDLSPGMVDEAIARAQRGKFAEIRGQVCDVQSLPFEDERFDVVIANHMLYHVPDPDRGVAELARVVHRDGVVLVATNGYGHMREINDAIAEVFGAHGEGLYDVFGIDTGEARLREQFTSVVWHAFDNDLVVDDLAAVVAYGLSFPPGELATDVQRQQFAEAVSRRFDGPQLRIRTRTGVFVCAKPRESG